MGGLAVAASSEPLAFPTAEGF
ncbi:MAG: hypothetical protein QOD99_1819, partial [Chthoniobacter sp.]|nr:hypothetical protein [Chthoniobacter sp.]